VTDCVGRSEQRRLRGRRGLPLLLVALAAALGPARPAAADDELNGYLELTGAASRLNTEDATGASTDETARSFLQRYSLNFAHRFFPNLEFRVGGLYEHERLSTDLSGIESVGNRQRVLPYALFTLRTQIVLAEIGYDRRTERFDNDLSVSKLTQENWRANFGWNPLDLPRLRLELSRRNTFDLGREGLDTTEDRAQLGMRYSAETYEVNYRGSLERDTDHIHGGAVETNFQSAHAAWGDAWLDRRLTLSTDYTVSYRETTATGSSAGEIIQSVNAVAGLSSIDDTPDHDPLNPNAALIDGNLTVGAGVDLGLPPPGGDIRPRNIGLDLGFANQLNTILVWVDQTLPPSIAGSFSWKIYSSDDNLNWTLTQTLVTAPFGPFDNRFEIRFPALVTRYVKLVVSPLSPIVPDATSWPQILVTELEPQLRTAASGVENHTSEVSQLFNGNFRARLLNVPAFYYELGYFLSNPGTGPTQWALSNGLSVIQALSPILTGQARLSREDRQERIGRQTAYLFSGALTATPISTVQESLVVSAVNEQGDFGRDTASALFSSAAELYRGIGANLVVGRSVIRPHEGGQSISDTGEIGVTLNPNSQLTVNLLLQDRVTDTTFPTPAQPEQRDDTRAAEIGAAYRPLRSLYLFASTRAERSNQTGSRTLRNYALSWAPFPDGTLHFSVFYDSTYHTELAETEQTLVPSVRWDVTSRIYLQTSYQDLRTDSVLGSTRTKVWTATVHAAF
jgi:hypothetical protein